MCFRNHIDCSHISQIMSTSSRKGPSQKSAVLSVNTLGVLCHAGNCTEDKDGSYTLFGARCMQEEQFTNGISTSPLPAMWRKGHECWLSWTCVNGDRKCPWWCTNSYFNPVAVRGDDPSQFSHHLLLTCTYIATGHTSPPVGSSRTFPRRLS